jgi:hypothetical protein
MDQPSSKKNHDLIPETEILAAIREVRFGAVEIVLHESKVTEIRQTKRVRFGAVPQKAQTPT